jgi:glyoxylase-like metal-dependent hydrolase (beta-lactamase superfamily II)
MTATITVLELGNVSTDSMFASRGRTPGVTTTHPCYGFLIRGASDRPILVDTGYRNAEVLTRVGFSVDVPVGFGLDAQLAAQDLDLGDLEMVVMTHLHVDHTGGIERIPPCVPLVVNRRELEYAAGGAQTFAYAPEDLHPTIDRIYQPGAMRFLDLDLTGPVEIADGVVCDLTGGHTPGSMTIRVQTADGVATICGDIIYDAVCQLVQRPGVLAAAEPQVSNNFSVSTLAESAAIKRALNATTYLMPSHDAASIVRRGEVVGMLEGHEVPGPHTPVDAETPSSHLS